MMEITFKTAKLAKEKGFNTSSIFHYNDNGEKFAYDSGNRSERERNDDVINASTQELLKKWLRENYNIEVEVYRTSPSNTDKLYGCQGENWNANTEEEFELFNIYDNEYEEVFERGLYLALESLENKK